MSATYRLVYHFVDLDTHALLFVLTGPLHPNFFFLMQNIDVYILYCSWAKNDTTQLDKNGTLRVRALFCHYALGRPNNMGPVDAAASAAAAAAFFAMLVANNYLFLNITSNVRVMALVSISLVSPYNNNRLYK